MCHGCAAGRPQHTGGTLPLMLPQLPPPPKPPALEWHQPNLIHERASLGLAQEPPSQQPRAEIGIEVFGDPALQEEVDELTRRLGRRRATRSVYRVYQPTILELIRLVQRNPERPRDRAWSSTMALNLGYDADAGMVTVTYCVERCGFNPRTGARDPRRRLRSYSAPMEQVLARVDARLGQLAKYAGP